MKAIVASPGEVTARRAQASVPHDSPARYRTVRRQAPEEPVDAFVSAMMPGCYVEAEWPAPEHAFVLRMLRGMRLCAV
ncbi:MAG: hypothetical protein RMJ43_09940 [Chloroherpetonaceae bacterium]|nr:hypothetical protein [Chloroherpetonaceae bacterium]